MKSKILLLIVLLTSASTSFAEVTQTLICEGRQTHYIEVPVQLVQFHAQRLSEVHVITNRQSRTDFIIHEDFTFDIYSFNPREKVDSGACYLN